MTLSSMVGLHFIAKPMFAFLNFLHNYIGNWGWAIVVLTLVIRIVLFPLTYKGMLSMNKLKELAPKVKEIQTKYKDDKQKMQVHMMELYKKHGANPMGGCLPILLQIPVFFAIYRVLLNAIELKRCSLDTLDTRSFSDGSILCATYLDGSNDVFTTKTYTNDIYRSYARKGYEILAFDLHVFLCDIPSRSYALLVCK